MKSGKEMEDWFKSIKKLQKAFKASDERRIRDLKTNKDNGKAGWWRVDGIRHSALVAASSAPEAVKVAMEDGAVSDWELLTASFFGEKLPNIIRLY